MILTLALIVALPATVAGVLIGWERALRPPPPHVHLSPDLQARINRLAEDMNELGRLMSRALAPAIARVGAAMIELSRALNPYGLSRADLRALRLADLLARIDGGRR